MMSKTTSLPTRPVTLAGRMTMLILSLALAAGLWVQSTPHAFAQDTGGVLLNEATQFLNSQEYEKAREKLEDLTTNYKSSLAVAEGYAKLGYVYLLLNDFEKARKNLEEAIEWPNASETVVQLARNLLPQAISAQASAVEDDDAKKKALYDEAIAAFNVFIENYPDAGAATEGAYYGKALAQYFKEEYQAGVDTLNQVISLYPEAETIGENKYLLAVALSSRAVKLYREDYELNRQEYMDLQQKSLGLLKEVMAMEGAQRNEAVINDAHFQSGEILLNLAAVVQDQEEKESNWTRALEQYRQVKPREAMLQALQEQIDRTIARIRDAIRARNQARREQIEAIRDRLMLKLIQVRNKPPQTIDAKLGMARVLYQQQRYDATRVLLRFLSNFELSEQQSKNLLYYLTLSYAQQGLIDQAIGSFENFQEKFAGDTMAENLPLVMGNLFLGGENSNPERAMEFYEVYFENYPQGELRPAAWASYAKALELLGQFDKAQEAYAKAEEAGPTKEVALTIAMGEANSVYNQQKFEEAITKFDAILEKYAGVPGSEEALYRKGSAILHNGSPGEAIPVLREFRDNNPDHVMKPFVLNDLGWALAQAGLNADPREMEYVNEGISLLRNVPQEFPDSPVGPYSYLQLANVQANLGNVEGMREAYQNYLTQYPEDPQIYFAYNQLASLLLNEQRKQDAAVLWSEFVNDYPEHENVDVALMTVAELWQQSAANLGPYNGLDSGKQAEWTNNMRLAVDSAERLVRNYPESQWVTRALTLLRDVKERQARLRLVEREEVATYLEDLANGLAATPQAMAKAMFTFASFIYPTEPERAIEIMGEYFDPELKLAPQDLDIYGLELVEAGELEKAEQIFQKILEQNPAPEGVPTNQYPADVANARAIGMFGLGQVATARGDVDKAGEFFTQLRQDFPWHPKIGEARYGIALSLFRDEKYEEALKEVVEIIRDRSKAITSELRANALLLGGKALIKRNQPADPAEENGKSDLEIAREYIQKVPVAYKRQEFAVAQAYWLLAKIYDMQGKTEKREEALRELEKIPDTPFSNKPISDPIPDK